MKSLSDKQRAKLIGDVTRLGCTGGVVTEVLAKGSKLTAEQRDELLAAVREGRYVEISMRVAAFEQFDNEPNRNFVRFTPKAMKQLASTAKSMPFIRDHAQYEALARAGSILSASLEKGSESSVLYEDVSLTAPWAVDLALRGLISSVSIGWHPTGPVLCSSCTTQVFSRCYHFPGDRLAEVEDEGGGKRKVRKADGPEVVEWVFTSVELVETSIVTVPAVPSARIEEIRAAMSAALGAAGAADLCASAAQKEDEMFDLERMAKILGVAATEEAVMSRATALRSELEIAQRDLEESKKARASAEAQLAILHKEAGNAKREEFLRAAVASGKITTGDKELWATFYDANQEAAIDQMGKRPSQSATPVGAKLQSSTPPAASASPGAGGALDADVSTGLDEIGVSVEAASAALKQLGIKDPKKALNTYGREALGAGKDN